MRKISFHVFAASLLLANSAIAQVSFGPIAGLNIATTGVKSVGESVSTKMKIGYHVGAVANISITDNFSVTPGILFSSKGYKYNEEQSYLGTKSSSDRTLTFNYLEVPVHVTYMFGQPDGGRFFVQAGPYLGYCIGGRYKQEVSYPGTVIPSQSTTGSIEVGTDETKDMVKPLDIGVNAGIGYKLPMGLFFRAQYGFGLTNNLPGGDSDDKMSNRVIGISVGFLFGGKDRY